MAEDDVGVKGSGTVRHVKDAGAAAAAAAGQEGASVCHLTIVGWGEQRRRS